MAAQKIGRSRRNVSLQINRMPHASAAVYQFNMRLKNCKRRRVSRRIILHKSVVSSRQRLLQNKFIKRHEIMQIRILGRR